MDCFLFDVDGTLVDTRELLIRSLVHTVRTQAGKVLDPMRLKDQADISPKAVLSCFGIMSLDQYWRDYVSHLEHAKLFHNDTAEVLQELTVRRIKLGVVSSLKSDMVDRLLNHFGLRQYFQAVVGWHRCYKKT